MPCHTRIPTCPDCGERRPVLSAPQRHQPTCPQADEGNVASAGEYSAAPSQIRALSAAGRRWFKAAMREKRLPALRRVQCEAAGEHLWRIWRKETQIVGEGKARRAVEKTVQRDYTVRLFVYALPDGGRGELRLRVDEQGELLPEARAYLERVGAVASEAVQPAVDAPQAAAASETPATVQPMPASEPEAPRQSDESPAPVSVAVEAVEARPGASTSVEVPVRLTRMVALHSARQGRRLEEPVPLTVVKRRPDDWGLAVEAARAWLASQLEAAKRRPCDG